LLTKWLAVLELAILLGGLAGSFTGMYLLATRPLFGMSLILASMATLLSSVAKLSEAQELRQQLDAGGKRFAPSRASRSAK
jgi:hypothetical protein